MSLHVPFLGSALPKVTIYSLGACLHRCPGLSRSLGVVQADMQGPSPSGVLSWRVAAVGQLPHPGPAADPAVAAYSEARSPPATPLWCPGRRPAAGPPPAAAQGCSTCLEGCGQQRCELNLMRIPAKAQVYIAQLMSSAPRTSTASVYHWDKINEQLVIF